MSKEYYGVKDLPERIVFRKNGEIITTMEFIEKFNATCQELSEAKASCVVHRVGIEINKYDVFEIKIVMYYNK